MRPVSVGAAGVGVECFWLCGSSCKDAAAENFRASLSFVTRL